MNPFESEEHFNMRFLKIQNKFIKDSKINKDLKKYIIDNSNENENENVDENKNEFDNIDQTNKIVRR